MINKSIISFLVILLVISSIGVLAVNVGTWRGYVYTGGYLAADGVYVTAHVDNSSAAVATTIIGGAEYASDAPSGYYSLDVPCTGNTVNFKVCGIAVSIPSESCTSGPHYNGTLPNFNLSVSTLAGGSCSYSCGCSGGHCCSGATEYTDGSGTGTCQSSACTTTTTVPPSGGGGPGGGGIPITATTTAVTTTTTAAQQETETATKIENGTSATFNITKSDTLKVESIDVEVKNTVNNVQISVKESSLPAGANVAISSDTGAVYKYLEITKTNVQDTDINKVKIKFKVEKSWADANNIDPATIALQRLVGSSWTKLTTTLVSQDSTYYYFEAESPGLSVFAIIGQKKPTPTATTTTTTTQPIPPVVPKISVLYIVAIFSVVLIALVLFFALKSKKKTS